MQWNRTHLFVLAATLAIGYSSPSFAVDPIPTPDPTMAPPTGTGSDTLIPEPEIPVEPDSSIDLDAEAQATPVPPSIQDTRSSEPTALSQEPDVPMAEMSEVAVEKGRLAKAIEADCHCEPQIGAVYRDRRTRFGSFIDLRGGTYAPKNFLPDFFVGQTYDSVYKTTTLSYFEFRYTFKWNSPLGSFGPALGAGFFSNSTNDGQGKLSVIPVQAGGHLALDTIFQEPYVVPFVDVGAYTAFYDESLASQKVTGRTPFRLFYDVGVALQLDWIDDDAHLQGFRNYGLENTFLVVELKQFMGSSSDLADFSAPPFVSAGLRMEF